MPRPAPDPSGGWDGRSCRPACAPVRPGRDGSWRSPAPACPPTPGIPDYRGPSAARARTPMTYQEFTAGPVARQRYWARSHLGWRTCPRRPQRRPPGPGRARAARLAPGVITQNVDGLHQAAGSRERRGPARPDLDRVGLPGLRRRSARASDCTSGWRRPMPASAPLAAGDQPGRRRGPRRRQLAASTSCPARSAAGSSSRTSCSSARTSRRGGSTAATRWSGGRACWSSAPH